MNLANLTTEQKAVIKTEEIWESFNLTLQAVLNDVNSQVLATGNPQDYFSVLGERGKEALESHQLAVRLCEKLGGTPTTLPKDTLTINADGTVTFTPPSE